MRNLFLLLFLTSSLALSAQETERCSADQWQAQLFEKYPEAYRTAQAQENYIRNWIQNQAAPRNGAQITIPVVVHIVYQEDAHNIPDLWIQSQIEVLNEDFRLLNENVRYIPTEFQNIATDTEIEFCLASLDPQGLPTNGITRTPTQVNCIGDIFTVEEEGKSRLFYSNLGGKDAWDTESYLNIWVANSCNTLLGVAPGTAFIDVAPEEDGVVIDWKHFGNNCESSEAAPYHLGRTATHEIGHYLNLKHPWSSCNSSEGDLVDDTPAQSAPYFGCPIYPQRSCGSNDVFMNFMNYTDDACMSMFTVGQKARMLAMLDGPRSGLKNSDGCSLIPPPSPFDKEAINIYPNPVKDCIHIDFNAEIAGDIEVKLADAAGRIVYQIIESSRNFRSIDTSRLQSGVYFLYFQAGKRTITKKILVTP